ncbi:MAG: 16S rRNA (uracil(1498)-N(3))-methyltransferase [Myxococcales bacterium]|nr:16S rRNA (uracil(1498)-N(3))-methyltransferase [Myxococcales bacterium]MCB9567209.1 16S rRNA (uracil(1498)-N(3))-methyltransferase [Myxococcales bacterium]MCB9704263.1 16S rRNA (uracil(1498)-N(3))-methyltransferase [Myxococcales bacterium]
MNLLLVDDADLIGEGVARIGGRRLEHVRKVLGAGVGERLRVGRVDGLVGEGTIVAVDGEAMEVRFEVDAPPPAPLPVTLVFALPRPPSLRKVLQQATALGVKRFVAIGSARVERSFWGSSALRPAALREEMILGLEQARDTALPSFESWPRLGEFMRERWPALRAAGRPLLADAGDEVTCPCGHDGSELVLVVGPEGGFIDREIAGWLDAGCELVRLGPRTLRVETAVVALLGRMIGPTAPAAG